MKKSFIEVKYREHVLLNKVKFGIRLAKKSENKLIVVTKNEFAIQGEVLLIPAWMLK